MNKTLKLESKVEEILITKKRVRIYNKNEAIITSFKTIDYVARARAVDKSITSLDTDLSILNYLRLLVALSTKIILV